MFNLDQALQAVAGRKDFVIKRRDGLVLINYGISLPDSFEGIRENFRGVIFDEASGKIVSLPLHKFYNVNQKPFTQQSVIGGQEGMVFEKFDGTMTQAFELRGEIVLATRMGWDTEQAKLATQLLNKDSFLKRYATQEVLDGRTPVFEYVGPKNPVVLHYEREELVYLWSRDRQTGWYTRNPALAGSLAAPCFRYMTVNEVVAEATRLEEKEGFVVVLPGLWVKVKAPWYVDRHRAFDLLMRPAYCIYEMALDDQLDDLIPLCADQFKPKLEAIAQEVAHDQLHLSIALDKEYESFCPWLLRHLDERERRKQFALAAKPSPNFAGLMALYANKPIDGWLKATLLAQYKVKYAGRLFANLPDTAASE